MKRTISEILKEVLKPTFVNREYSIDADILYITENGERALNKIDLMVL